MFRRFLTAWNQVTYLIVGFLILDNYESNSLLQLRELVAMPYPINLHKHNLMIDVDLSLHAYVEEINVHLEIEQRYGFMWFPLPCEDGVGSW